MRELQPYDDQESFVLYRPHGLGEHAHLIGDNLQVLRFHIPRHQRLDLFAGELKVVVPGSLHEEIGEIIAGIQALSLGRFHEAVEQTGSIGTVIAAVVHPVLASLDVDSDRLLAVVVIDFQLCILEGKQDLVPLVEDIGDSPFLHQVDQGGGEGRILKPGVEVVEDRYRKGLPLRNEGLLGDLACGKSCPKLGVDLVQPGDPGDGGPCKVVVLGDLPAVLEPSCDMGKADAPVGLAKVGIIGSVAVRHHPSGVAGEHRQRRTSAPVVEIPVPGEVLVAHRPHVVPRLLRTLLFGGSLIHIKSSLCEHLRLERFIGGLDAPEDRQRVVAHVLPADVDAVKAEGLAQPVVRNVQPVFLVGDLGQQEFSHLGLGKESSGALCAEHELLRILLHRILPVLDLYQYDGVDALEIRGMGGRHRAYRIAPAAVIAENRCIDVVDQVHHMGGSCKRFPADTLLPVPITGLLIG